MYQNTNLQSYIEKSSSVNVQSLVVAEWNLNFADNILELGNYRYRPSIASPTENNFGVIKADWAKETVASSTKYYYGATDSSTVINTGINLTTSEPLINSTINQTEKMLYSLSDTVGRFRPRSGINKIRYFGDNYINYANETMHRQPRFYLASKDDKFKYWTSYRVESQPTGGIERGIALTTTGASDYFIDDAAPFVVYDKPVPANRIVVKMQTGVGDYDNGTYYKTNNTPFADPFYEDPSRYQDLINQKTPAHWRVQYLGLANDGTTWTWKTAQEFTLNQQRTNGKRVIGSDGYVELAYGITNAPTTFRLLGEVTSQYALPLSGAIGDAYLVPDSTNTTAGKIYHWTNNATNLGDGAPLGYSSFVPTYGWYLNEEGITEGSSNLTELTSPKFYGTATSLYTPTYRELQFVKGIRIVVDSMTQYGSTFDLIEMSPRLVANLSDKTVDYSIEKIASDIGNTGIPVGQLLASTGSISIFDYDQSFNEYNKLSMTNGKISGSLIADISSKNLQFKFYEQIIDDRQYPTISSYFVPIKTMYVDGFPKMSTADRKVSLTLRDMLFYFESIVAPSIMLKNVSVSKAVATILDNVGFSNYNFFRVPQEAEDVIPYFFVAPDTTVAEVLNDIAQSTQTCMFFNENNDLVTMSKNYMMPALGDRQNDIDITLHGTKDFASTDLTGSSGILKNYYDPYNSVDKILSNIISLDAEDDAVYNAGKVIYSNKYIQKSYSTIKEASMLNKSQTYKYKPVLLWEVSGTESLRPVNDEVGNQSAYSLSALVLNSELSNVPPNVVNGQIVDNIMDVGQSIYWLTRYKGYLYANSEIIKYDAVEHIVTGEANPVWIEDVSDYQKYFAKLPFNGKIFPTGRIRIYAEPAYDNTGAVVDGATAKHGRGQFGTTIATHPIFKEGDINNSWTNPSNHKSFKMQSSWIFDKGQYGETLYKITSANASGKTITNAITTGLVSGLKVYDYNTPKTISIASGNPDTSITFNGKKAIKITSAAHGFVVGNQIEIAGVVPTSYRGTYEIVDVETNKFTIINKNNASGDFTTAGTAQLLPKYGHPKISAGTQIDSVSATTITLTKAVVSNITGGNTTLYFTSDLLEPLGNIQYSSTTDSIGFLTEKPTVTTTTKDFFDSSSYTENDSTETLDKSAPNGSIKSSALAIQGPSEIYSASNQIKMNDVVSYSYKDYSQECPNAYSFGTRMRIVGRPFPSDDAINAAKQVPVGGELLTTVNTKNSGHYEIAGTGGGIAIGIDPGNNNSIGYYFEIDALSHGPIIDKVDNQDVITTISNVFFYKVMKGANSKEAIPVVLWSGNAPILVDDGQFIGMSKSASTKTPTVYDLLIETEDVSETSKKFYLYINGKLIQTVQDDDAIPTTATNKNVALFVRGRGLCMFEHVFAIGDNAEKPNSVSDKKTVFADEKLDNENYRKYLVNPAVLQTYLQGIGSAHHPKYSLYYEEFGTIMRECAYFNVKYDKAYPALYSKISPTFNDSQGYVVSNFRSNPYGAEFLIFNATDFALNLDESTGNYLRIQGVTFTQQSAHEYTVDEYFQKNSKLDNYSNYSELNNKYIDIQNSRNTYGRKEFNISGSYIQNFDTANGIMQWMVNKVMRPKKSVGVSIFANPMIQLGDIVTINYNVDNVLQNSTSRFVVYHITYERSGDGPSMKLYLSEVV